METENRIDVPGARGVGIGSYCLIDTVSVWGDGNVLEAESHHGCTIW